MKKIIFYITILCVSLIFSCSNEKLENTESLIDANSNFSVTENTNNFQLRRASLVEPCVVTPLIAGQNMEIGKVTVDIITIDSTVNEYNLEIGEYIILKYMIEDIDWTISLTHLSLGDCGEQWVPTTGSGNPKVGRFEHTEPHSAGTNEVIYAISLDLLDTDTDGNYCFAAHAEVDGPTGGETAWAEGFPFDGNNWAMYKEANLSDCDLDAPPVQK